MRSLSLFSETRLTFAVLLTASGLHAAPAAYDESLRNEVSHAMGKGIQYLLSTQAQDGHWSDAKAPGITALGLMALEAIPMSMRKQVPDSVLDKAERFILSQVKADGGIYAEGYANYNTSLCMMALASRKKIQHVEVIRKARQYLAGLQEDKGTAGVADSLADGGIGYGSKPIRDLNNTYYALEALKATQVMGGDVALAKLDWKLAMRFVERCQNLKPSNDQDYASMDPKNKGGFMYAPGNSKAGDTVLNGKTVHRSYGSQTYAGALTMIYGDIPPEDVRVKAAMEWASRNFTVDENPGMGLQGYYFYLLTMSKAYHILGWASVPTAGKPIAWKPLLAEKLINMQKMDGSWFNEAARWQENDPILCTTYALMALRFSM
jgi:squalene-hopene/tetraprenyl-beta-curcumene cyclase